MAELTSETNADLNRLAEIVSTDTVNNMLSVGLSLYFWLDIIYLCSLLLSAHCSLQERNVLSQQKHCIDWGLINL